MVTDPDNDRSIFEAFQNSRVAAGTLCGLGNVCLDTHLHHLVVELLVGTQRIDGIIQGRFDRVEAHRDQGDEQRGNTGYRGNGHAEIDPVSKTFEP